MPNYTSSTEVPLGPSAFPQREYLCEYLRLTDTSMFYFLVNCSLSDRDTGDLRYHLASGTGSIPRTP